VAKGLTKSALADLLDIWQSTVGDWERDEEWPTLERRDQLIAILGIDGEDRERVIDLQAEARTNEEGKILRDRAKEKTRKEVTAEFTEALKKQQGNSGGGEGVALVPMVFGGNLRQLPVGVETMVIPEMVLMENGEVIAYRVHGEALVPRLKDGDIVVASLAGVVSPDDLCLFHVGQRVDCRVWHPEGDKVRLLPINPNEPTLEYDIKEIMAVFPVVWEMSRTK
jgi:transcriptional regulator with XRE-family HTH domain